MRIQHVPPIHLTYCLNIHPGESWAENLIAITTHAARVRDRVAPDQPFGLGLRLSAVAAGELTQPDALDGFRDLLAAEGMYVFTINGFPYGTFHGEPVKQNVYRPDWRSVERRDYTLKLADILAALLLEQAPGSISTVPGAYREWIATDADVEQMCLRFAEVAARLAKLKTTTGRDICLAIEPEPDCYMETVGETIDFLTGPLRRFGREYLGLNFGLPAEDADALLARHVGLCLDTAHAAVAFESPADCLRRAMAAGVRIAKVQLSAAIEADSTEAARQRLADFCDEVYLHQSKSTGAGTGLRSCPDLPDALGEMQSAHPVSPWRVHFHVPLHWGGDEVLRSTRGELTGDFAAALRNGASRHLEIETYTFDVLPDDVRPADVAESITLEYRWVLENVLG
ncbi:MAG: metabolite traffic protein EboE [Phycisphaerae bacterium]